MSAVMEQPLGRWFGVSVSVLSATFIWSVIELTNYLDALFPQFGGRDAPFWQRWIAIGFGLAAIVLCFTALYLFVYGLITQAYDLLPEGMIKRRLEKDIAKRGSLYKQIKGISELLALTPQLILFGAMGIVLLIVLGLLALWFLSGIGEALGALRGAPAWAIIIIVLLVALLFKDNNPK